MAVRGASLQISRPIKVLFVNDHLGLPGGLVHGGTTYLTNTLPAFDRARVQPSLLIFRSAHPAAERLETDGVQVHFLGRSKWDPRALTDLAKLVRAGSFDLLHVNGKKAHLMGRLVGRWTKTPTIIHLHFQYSPRPAWLQRILAPRTAMALTVSNVLKAHAIAEFGIPPARARTAYNGLQVARFRNPPMGARVRIREELELDDTRSLVTLVGRIMPEGSPADKGQTIAIRALARLKDTHPQAVLALVGGGPGREECEALAAELGLGDRTRFLGQRSDIPEILAATDVFVVPSAQPEAFAYSCLEAMCSGCPVIATRIGGLPEMLGDGERGLLVPPHDAVGLAEGIAHLLEHPDEAARLADTGQQFASALTVERHVEQLTDVYDEILADREAP